MTLNFTVERTRGSVTQGMAMVKVNGKEVVNFGDTITLDGKIDVIGGWGSIVTDERFISACIEHYNEEILKALGLNETFEN